MTNSCSLAGKRHISYITTGEHRVRHIPRISAAVCAQLREQSRICRIMFPEFLTRVDINIYAQGSLSKQIGGLPTYLLRGLGLLPDDINCKINFWGINSILVRIYETIVITAPPTAVQILIKNNLSFNTGLNTCLKFQNCSPL